MTETTKTPVLYVRLADMEGNEKSYHVLSRVDDPEKALYWDVKQGKKFFSGRGVGQTYTIPTTQLPEGKVTLYFGERKWEGLWKDEERCLQEQAKQRASEVTATAKAKEAREATSTSTLDEPLRKLGRAYADLPAPHRLAFELWVLQRIRRGGR